MRKITVKDLEFAPREEGYARGRKGHEQILRAALEILLDEGFAGMSLRAVARRCEMNVGNVYYYFGAKEDLIRELLNAVISAYETVFEDILNDEHLSPEQRLLEVVELILDDITTRKTSLLFPELWNLSNRDQFAKERMNELYARSRNVFIRILKEMRPDLSEADRLDLIVFLQASMEGHTVFTGYQREFEDRSDAIINIAQQSFLYIINAYKRATPSGDS